MKIVAAILLPLMIIASGVVMLFQFDVLPLGKHKPKAKTAARTALKPAPQQKAATPPAPVQQAQKPAAAPPPAPKTPVVDPAEGKRLTRLASIYEQVPPEEATRILKELPDDTLQKLLDKMDERKVAKLLQSMEPKRAAKLTLALAARTPEEPAAQSR